MSNFDWEKIYSEYERATQDGGGYIIVSPDGSVQKGTDFRHEMNGELYEEGDEWYYEGHNLSKGEFVDNGITYYPMNASEIAHAGFLEYKAKDSIAQGKAVLLGSSIIPEADDVWFFLVQEQ